jgi:hypothetical protein
MIHYLYGYSQDIVTVKSPLMSGNDAMCSQSTHVALEHFTDYDS